MINGLKLADSISTNDFYRIMLDKMINAFALHRIITDDSGKACDYEFIEVNPSFELMTGLKKEDIIGKKVSEIIHTIKDDEVKWIDIYGKVALTGEPISFDSYFAPFNKWYTINAFSPQAQYFITIFSDITQIKSNELTLRDINNQLIQSKNNFLYLQMHDTVTGLPNKESFIQDMDIMLNDPSRNDLALLYIDFDNFKFINSTLGHVFGEKYLAAITEQLVSTIPSTCQVYKMDGAEFVAVVEKASFSEEVITYAERILQCFSGPFILEGNKLHTSVSIGITMSSEQGNDSATLLNNANIAMQNAKTIGKNKFIFYAKEMREVVNERLIMEKYLHMALDNQEFEIYYQPQMDLATKKICGFEALLRWRNPELGFISPSVFIEIAESNHLIIPIGKWVLRNACYFIKKLQNKGYIDFTVAVNVSVIQLVQEDFVETVLGIVDLMDLDCRYLELEITESVFVESYEAVYSKLELLRKRGIKIALDDFGKGYSSLSQLHNLPIDILKVDKVFIDSILRHDAHLCITDMIIAMARKMNIVVLAEGVEKQEQMDYLIMHQCDRMQGYLFSKPIPERDILASLKNIEYSKSRGFKWKDEYSIHIPSIDEQHKRLFEIGNILSEIVFSDQSNEGDQVILPILNELKDYVVYHIHYEEDYMLMLGYRHLEKHMNDHKVFVDKVNEVYEAYLNHVDRNYFMALIDMVTNWIINHILKEDIKLKNTDESV